MRDDSRPLRVCIDARIEGGAHGGVEQFVIGLVDALSRLKDGEEEYLVSAYVWADDWIRPYVAGPCRIVHGLAATRHPGWARVFRAMPGVRRAAYNLLSPFMAKRQADGTSIPRSDGSIEKLGVDLIHFPTQSAFLTSVPSIYHPWDLQHLHLPEFFTPEEIRQRETFYRTFCKEAQMVVAATEWNRHDIINHYQLSEEKVRVVPAAPVLDAYPQPTPGDLAETRRKFSLPDRFIFYPAQTWPHKNHLGLLEALALLRVRQGLVVNLVLSGKLTDFYSEIKKRIRELNITEQVRFLGFVSPVELQCLYQLCRCLVFPTKFEGFGMPLTEAFLTNVPSACSNVTSLPHQAGDAAIIFDPDNYEEIADAIRRLWTDDALCHTLRERGKLRVRQFTWNHSARLFRAHYRRIANRPLTEGDRSLLAAPPLV